MTTDKIIELLSEFEPFKESDLENDNESFLNEIMAFLKSNNDYIKAIGPIFHLMEKYPHADLGSPGPLVHTLEGFKGEYENYLLDSLKRKPTPLTVWMLNRIINAEEALTAKKDLINLMSSLLQNQNIDDETRTSIQDFISFQMQSSS